MNRTQSPPQLFWLFLLLFLAGLFPVSTFSQWSSDGVRVDPGNWALYYTLLNAETDGDFYVGWTRPGSSDARVQRFNENGERLWGETGARVVADSLDSSGYLLGIVPDGEDGVLAAYLSFLGETAFVRVQKFSSSGERLWGAVGVPGSAWAGESQFNTSRRPIWFLSDSDGGGWILWETVESSSIHISGVNADGSLKLPDSVINLGAYDYTDFDPLFAPDGEGGLVVFWSPPHEEPNCKRVQAAHISAEGEVVFNDIVMELPSQSLSYFATPCRLVPTNDGGYYFSTYIFLQRFDANLQPLWPYDEGIDIPVPRGSNRIEPLPVLLEDNLLIRCNADGDSLLMLRVDQDGNLLDVGWRTMGRQLGTDAGIIYESAVLPDQNSFYICRTFTYSSNTRPINVQRINGEGLYQWPGDTLIFPENPVAGYGGLPAEPPIVLPDGSLVMSILDWGPHTTTLYRVFPDGRVAGRDTFIDGEMDPALPAEYQIVRTYPNPFNNEVLIEVASPVASTLELHVYNVRGQQVDRIRTDTLSGVRTLAWRPTPHHSSGIYFIRLNNTKRASQLKKILYLP